jgi:WD40 repeat protein
VWAVAISPDGTWLASGGIDGTVRIWGADGTARRVLTGGEPIAAVAISPDGTWLASGGEDTVRIWNADGTSRAVLTGHAGLDVGVMAIAVSSDGAWLATAGGDDGTVRIWAADASNSSCNTAIRIGGDVLASAWFPRSTDLCVAAQWGLYRFELRPPDR